MRFFLDNCTSPYHAKGMQGFAELQQHEFKHLRQKFEQDISDVDWIRAIAAEGDWVIISGDTRITRNPVERAAWHESKLTAFFFIEPWLNDSYWKQSAALVHWWPTIAAQARKTPTGHGFIMPKLGKDLKQIYP